MMAADQRAANVDGMQWTGDIVESEGGESYSGSESDNENEDKRQFGIYQCLPVDDGEPEWEAGEPQTVEEYLRRVRCDGRRVRCSGQIHRHRHRCPVTTCTPFLCADTRPATCLTWSPAI